MALVLSGGGVFGAALLGALHCLHIDTFDVFAGTSIGAIISALLVIGHSPMELLRLIAAEPCLVSTDQIDLNRFGVASQNKIKTLLIKLFSEKTTDRSFQDIYKTFGKELIIVATNLSRQAPVYFQRHDFPDLSVIDALMMSSCVPMVFPYILFENDVYVDGFVTDNFPIKYVSERYKKEIVGINICKTIISQTNLESVNNYVSTLFNTFVESKRYRHDHTYEIHVSAQMNQLYASSNDLVTLFNEGYQQMTENLLKENKQKAVKQP